MKLKLLSLIIFLTALVIGTNNVAFAGECFFHPDTDQPQCQGHEPPPPMFEETPIKEDSILPNRSYAHMLDFADVYTEPSFGSQLLYNVGDGFLYVTIQGRHWDEVAREMWYMINPGQWVHQRSIREVEQPEFSGIVINTQPERPFGWVLARVTPSDEPYGEPNETYAPLERYAFFQVFEAVEDREGWLWYNIGGGKWIRQTFVSLIDVDPRPEGVGENEFWTEIDIYEQSFAAYEGDTMVYASLISTGLNRWPTREGLWTVEDSWEEIKMSGAEGRVDYYFVEDVPHTMFFDMQMGIALHGAYWHDRFGYKHSHGCVNMPLKAAEWTFEWAKGAPNPLWVNVHTSDPHHYFERFGDGDVVTVTDENS